MIEKIKLYIVRFIIKRRGINLEELMWKKSNDPLKPAIPREVVIHATWKTFWGIPVGVVIQFYEVVDDDDTNNNNN